MKTKNNSLMIHSKIPKHLPYSSVDSKVITISKCIALLFKQLAFWGSFLKQVNKNNK